MVDASPPRLDQNGQEKIIDEDRKKLQARRRWKIFCLVKESDTVADSTQRQEKLQERVDEWMSEKLSQLRVEEKPHSNMNSYAESIQVNGGLLDNSDSLDIPDASSFLQTKSDLSIVKRGRKKEEKTKEQRKHEREQRKRIKERQKKEKQKERDLILQGKLEATPDDIQNDPLLQVHRELEKRTKKKKSHKSSKEKKKPKISMVKMRWTNALEAMKAFNGDMLKNDNVDGDDDDDVVVNQEDVETIVANMVYNEATDTIEPIPDEIPKTNGATNGGVEESSKPPEGFNPVYNAFEDAKGVDDLYAIAEVWVNAPYYDF